MIHKSLPVYFAVATAVSHYLLFGGNGRVPEKRRGNGRFSSTAACWGETAVPQNSDKVKVTWQRPFLITCCLFGGNGRAPEKWRGNGRFSLPVVCLGETACTPKSRHDKSDMATAVSYHLLLVWGAAVHQNSDKVKVAWQRPFPIPAACLVATAVYQKSDVATAVPYHLLFVWGKRPCTNPAG